MTPRFVRSAGIVARAIAGETILVPVTRRAQDMGLLTLNEVGSFVWDALQEPSAVEELADRVSRHFIVEADEARADLEPFVALLQDTGCIEEASR